MSQWKTNLKQFPESEYKIQWKKNNKNNEKIFIFVFLFDF